MKKYIWLSVSIGILAGLSLIDCWRYLISRAILVAKFRGHQNSLGNTWEALPFSQKLALLNPWMVFITVGNIAQIFGVILVFADADNVLSDQDIIIGISCFCSWIYILRYLPHDSNSYTVINTFRRSVGTLAPYIIGILPIFMAYVFLGVSCFWQSGYYNNTIDGMISAYSLMNGDVVYDVFTKVTRQHSVLGMLYMYSFILFFICCVHNIFIAIIVEGFISLKEKRPKASDDIESDSEDSPPFSSFNSRPQLSLKELNKEQIRNNNVGRNDKRAFRRILDEGESFEIETTSWVDQTKHYENKLAEIKGQIDKNLITLKALADPPASERVDRYVLQSRKDDFINIELKQTIDRLFPS